MHDALRRWVPAIAATLPLAVIFVSVLSIPIAAGAAIGLDARQLSGWIFATYGVPALIGGWLAFRFKQPLLMTGNVAVIIFVASVGTDIPFPEIVGGCMVAGFFVAVLGLTPLMRRIAAWFPLAIVLGLIAGIVLPFVAGIFDALGQEPLLVGATVAAYLVSLRFFPPAVPPVLVAAAVGLGLAGLAGRLGTGGAPAELVFPMPTLPEFSAQGVLSVAPVVAALMLFQSNVPAIVFLRGQAYAPPERTIFAASGLGTIFGSLLGPTGVSVPVLAMPFTAGPQAGEKGRRHWTVYILSAFALIIAVAGAAAAAVAEAVPLPLLLAIAGLAMVRVLVGSLEQIVSGPLRLGPIITLAVAISDVELLGLGSIFWAIALGTFVTATVEREGLARLAAAKGDAD